MPLAGGLLLGIVIIVLVSYIVFKGNRGIAIGLLISTLIFFIAHNKMDATWDVAILNTSFPVSFGLLLFWMLFGWKIIIDPIINRFK